MTSTRRTLLGGVALLAGLALAACGGGGNPLSNGGGNGGGGGGGGNGGGGGGGSSQTLTVGSANFPENVVLADIYAGALRAQGVKVDKRLNIGDREVYIKALRDGSIDLIPEYTGNLLLYFDSSAKVSTSADVYRALQRALPGKLTVLRQSAAQDKDAVVVTRQTSHRLHARKISDLKGKAGKLVLGGPPEWEKRSGGVPGLKRVYGLKFKQFRKISIGQQAQFLKSGQVDAVNIFTTDPTIEENHFVVLQDDKHLFPAQNVVPLIAKDKATGIVRQSLDAVSTRLNTKTLTHLMTEVVVQKKDPGTVAQDWLSSRGLD